LLNSNEEKCVVLIHKSFIIRAENMAKKRPVYETFQT
jgi:hypothetical protein